MASEEGRRRTDRLILMYKYPKVFLYGFQPFLQYTHNITSDIISAVKAEKLAPSYVFPVEFNREMFEEKFTAHQPEIIIGMGMMERARKIRIERKAVNLTSQGEEITSGGASLKQVSLKIPKTPESTITYDAGQYVCNYSMYVGSEYSESHNCSYAFLHVPMSVEVQDVVSFLRETLKNVRKRSLT